MYQTGQSQGTGNQQQQQQFSSQQPLQHPSFPLAAFSAGTNQPIIHSPSGEQPGAMNNLQQQQNFPFNGAGGSSFNGSPVLASFSQPTSLQSFLPSSSEAVSSSHQSNPSPPASATTKSVKKQSGKKRKSAATDAETEEDKRTKTPRACDNCRRKKIRCDILPDAQPPLCGHCKNSNSECEFILPIAETRFKKKRLQQEEVASRAGTPLATPSFPLVAGTPSSSNAIPSSSSSKPSVRVSGPTSVAFLVHSTANLPPNAFDSYDLKNHTTWEISADGDGLIKVVLPPPGSEADPPAPHPPNHLTAQIIQTLVNDYFRNISPLLPIVSRAEFLSTPNPDTLLLYAICGVAATRRNVSKDVFNALRTTINGIIKNNDVLSDTSLETVRSLLVLSMVGDLHAQPVSRTIAAAVVRVGVAIRMAQDLGLHRELPPSATQMMNPAEILHLETKRRLWAGCVIMDRWYSASCGLPQCIDLLDCDVLLPNPEDLTIMDPSLQTYPFLFMSELLKLSILLGRVTKTIYGPTGLKHVQDRQLVDLHRDITNWRNCLPHLLTFRGTDSSYEAGVLHLLHIAIQFLFFRVFMRLNYECPPHLKFSLDVSTWSQLIRWSQEAIYWLDQNDSALDTLYIVSYAATTCALVQYHTWARRKDEECLHSLKVLRECVKRWEDTVQPDHMSIRRKTTEVMSLLYEAALHAPAPPPPTSKRLNPTHGVKNNREHAGKIEFRKDASRPGGGVYVGDEKAVETMRDVDGNLLVGKESDARTTPGGSGSFSAGNSPYGGGSQGSASHMSGSPSFLQGGDWVTGVPDAGLMEGMPGTIFDWGSWDQYFSRIIPNDPQEVNNLTAAGFPPQEVNSMTTNGFSPQEADNISATGFPAVPNLNIQNFAINNNNGGAGF